MYIYIYIIYIYNHIYIFIYSEMKYMIYIYIIVIIYIYIYIIHNGSLSTAGTPCRQLLGSRLEKRLGFQLRSCWQLLAQAHGGSSFINDEWLTTMVMNILLKINHL